MRKKLVLCFILFLSLPLLLFAETKVISGTQTKQGQFFSSKLEPDPVNLSRPGKITRVEGRHKGFWINKKKGYRVERTYRYSKSSEAKGETLGPGTYTVYPNLPKGESNARVRVYVELERQVQAAPERKTPRASAPVGTIAISGSQRAGSGPMRDAELGSEPVELPGACEIVKVEGRHRGFWINKVGVFGETKIQDYSSAREAIGIRLERGTYKVYPNIPEGARGADVTVYVKLFGSAQEKRVSSGDSDSASFYRKYCKLFVPLQPKFYKNMPEGTYEQMEAAGSVYTSVEDCVEKSLQGEQQMYSMCLNEGKTEKECKQFLSEMKEMYRKMATREGCTNLYSSFCGLYKLGMGEEGMPAEYKAKNDKLYRECMANVNDSCGALPSSVSW